MKEQNVTNWIQYMKGIKRYQTAKLFIGKERHRNSSKEIWRVELVQYTANRCHAMATCRPDPERDANSKRNVYCGKSDISPSRRTNNQRFFLVTAHELEHFRSKTNQVLNWEMYRNAIVPSSYVASRFITVTGKKLATKWFWANSIIPFMY